MIRGIIMTTLKWMYYFIVVFCMFSSGDAFLACPASPPTDARLACPGAPTTAFASQQNCLSHNSKCCWSAAGNIQSPKCYYIPDPQETLYNVALGKPTYSSSETTYHEKRRAVDGCRASYKNNAVPLFEGTGGHFNCCFSSTDQQSEPWWAVDLIKPMPVNYILTDTNTNARMDVQIKLSNSSHDPNAATDIKYCHSSYVFTGVMTSNITCTEVIYARYVIIQLTPASTQKFLSLCEVQVHSAGLYNAALGRPTFQSSQLDKNSEPYKNVDGSLSNEWWSNQCMHTEGSDPNPWWAVDLGQQLTVYSVTLVNKGDGHRNLQNLVISLSNSSGQPTSDLCGTHMPQIPMAAAMNIPCTQPVVSRYVIVQKGGGLTELVMCEALVEAGCPDGKYGPSCSLTCPTTCRLNGPCDKVTGRCPAGQCLPGLKGDRCDTVCSHGTYGYNCVSTCLNCKNNASCDVKTGHCPLDCEDGYVGSDCNQECPPKKYGYNCTKDCSSNCENGMCNNVHGGCKCKAGYIGTKCNEECPAHKYGDGCTSNCSSHCENGTCNHVHGGCNCKVGYTGFGCFNECPAGTYGLNCANMCSVNCAGNVSCSHITGHCPQGCKGGYESLLCDSLVAKPEESGPNVGAVVGAVLAIIVVVVVVVIVVFFILRRRKQNSDDNYSTHLENAASKNGYVKEPKKDLTINDDDVYSETNELGPKKGDKLNGQLTNINGTAAAYITDVDKEEDCDDYEFNDTELKSDKAATNEQLKAALVTNNIGVISELAKNNKSLKSIKDKSSDETTLDEKANDGLPKVTLIKVGDLAAYVDKMKNINVIGEEFQKIPKSVMPLSPCKYAEQKELNNKNRYSNILPYDDNRVKLQKKGDNRSDYINASYIKGYDRNNAYIAASGTTEQTEDDFWRMIWEQNIEILIMVTNVIEQQKKKCTQYWPDSKKTTEDDIVIEATGVQPGLSYITRKFRLTKNGSPKEVTQYHFIDWPEKQLPEYTPGLYRLLEVMRDHRSKRDTPILVHCSSGVGRTGTLIALDILLDQYKREKAVDVFKCVVSLAEQRNNMIQTEVQYEFIHDYLRKDLVVGHTTLHCSQFSSQIRKSKIDFLDRQFKLLEKTKPVFTDKELKLARIDNENKNRDNNVVPVDADRAKLTSAPDNYVNAVKIEPFKTVCDFCATQVPMKNTMSEFWQLMFDIRSTSVVCLENDPNFTQWLPEENDEVNSLRICVNGVTENGGIKQYDITLKINDVYVDMSKANIANSYTVERQQELHNLKVFVPESWTGKGIKERNPKDIVNLYTEVHDWQKQNGKKTVTVMCLNGAKETGVYIACHRLFDIANIQSDIDVYHVVKQIKKKRPQLISSKDQYSFLHSAVQQYLQHSQCCKTRRK